MKTHKYLLQGILFKCYVFMILVCGSAAAVAAAEPPLTINIAYFGESDSSSALGVILGIDESNLQGEFMGQKYVGKTYKPVDLIPVKNPKPSAILVDADVESLRILSQLNPDVPIFNLTERHDILRHLCLPNVLHVSPSEKMIEDAQKQWKEKHPESKAMAQSWHPEYKRYASGNLSNRFRRVAMRKMDDASWAGWAAVRMVAEAVVRTESSEPKVLLDYLKNDLVFDGNKGVKMSFRGNGQLRQRLFMVENGKVVGEAPVAGVVNPADLDTLGFISKDYKQGCR